MQKNIILLIALFILLGCNSSLFKIEGEIINAEGQTLLLKEYTLQGEIFVDSVKIKKDGVFRFKNKSEFPTFYLISLSNKPNITLLVEPGEQIKINIDANKFQEYEVSGSNGSLLVQDINNQLIYTKKKLAKLSKEYDEAENKKEIVDDLNEQYRNIIDQQRDSSIAFIIRNLNSLASITALYQKFDDENYVLYKNRDIQYVKIVAESLQKKYPESPFVKAIVADKENLVKNYEALRTKNKLDQLTKDANISNIPEIELPNLDGDTISLNSLEKEVILISFWASWNTECIKLNLAWKDIYERYKLHGFEIYQVSLDTKKETWQRAVEFDQLPWINVSDLQGLNSYAARTYNIKEVPTTFLIRNNEIIARNLPIEELKRRLSIAFD